MPEKLTETAAGIIEENISGFRPASLAEFIGQGDLKNKLGIYIQAARKRGEPLDHCLFYGPPGLGKTTLAGIIANEMRGQFRVTSGPALERAGDLAAILSNLQPNDVLFIDEIHRLSPAVEEVLYPGMEDFFLDIIVGKGPLARNIRLQLPPFTLVGATTRLGLLTSPLRARFGIVEQLELYAPEDVSTIIVRGARLLSIDISSEAAMVIAKSARGTPRVALRLLRRVRDVAEVRCESSIDVNLARTALNMLGVDSVGMDERDRRYLYAVIDLFGGGPVGLSTLSAALNEEAQTIEDIYEPFLIQKGFIERTPRGRKATRNGYGCLDIEYPVEMATDQRTFLLEEDEAADPEF
ncbi:MAG: Holliday junction branch migration DNA helicase RuvB [Thermovirgaceae bacterium]|nr:Holliday junction branch migration DNA helicase RuvB [Thermovirgaceae bacterium]